MQRGGLRTWAMLALRNESSRIQSALIYRSYGREKQLKGSYQFVQVNCNNINATLKDFATI